MCWQYLYCNLLALALVARTHWEMLVSFASVPWDYVEQSQKLEQKVSLTDSTAPRTFAQVLAIIVRWTDNWHANEKDSASSCYNLCCIYLQVDHSCTLDGFSPLSIHPWSLALLFQCIQQPWKQKFLYHIFWLHVTLLPNPQVVKVEVSRNWNVALSSMTFPSLNYQEL